MPLEGIQDQRIFVMTLHFQSFPSSVHPDPTVLTSPVSPFHISKSQLYKHFSAQHRWVTTFSIPKAIPKFQKQHQSYH